MGKWSKKYSQKQAAAVSATEMLAGGIPTEARQLGRRLVLTFISSENPVLDRIEFYGSHSPKHEFRQRADAEDTSRSFKTTSVTQALAIVFLDYLCGQLQTPPKFCLLEGGKGSLAASLGNAIAKSNGSWFELFVEFPAEGGGKRYRVNDLFKGGNWDGKKGDHRIISINSDYLPSDCVEIVCNKRRLEGLPEIQNITARFRMAWNLPPPSLSNAPIGNQKPQSDRSEAPKADPVPEKPPQERSTKSKAEPESVSTPSPIPSTAAPSPKSGQPFQKSGMEPGAPVFEFKLPKDPQRKFARPTIPATWIDPKLFEIRNPDELEWDDNSPLLNFGLHENEDDVWRIRNASEGVLIFGGVGSGKTSGSGSNLAAQFLQAGYGGLILTAKPDEAARWLRLCEWTGRTDDCIHITPDSGHKLNVLQYEFQRPGNKSARTDDLIALVRRLLEVMSGDLRGDKGDRFWRDTGDQLMRWLFEVFVLSEEPLVMDNLLRFLQQAPLDENVKWEKIEYFGDLIYRAEEKASKGSPGDQSAFYNAFDYWTKAFPRITEVTRSGIVTSFSAMVSTLNARGIHELLCQETNITPEMLLSGKICILDFPLKESTKGGLMVQAAWKLLFEQAIERRSDKGRPIARPVFLWEDEGHLFFSSHDVNFQPTARDCRASHVILSQNIHNFLHLGHGEHSIYAVFSAMNTNIFHTNGDTLTNRFASEKIGMEKKTEIKSNNVLRPFSDADLTLWPNRPEEFKSVGGFNLMDGERQAVRPDEFAMLKPGGDGTCEAIILWLSHKFAANRNRSFIKRPFVQEPKMGNQNT